ncbi:MAG: N-acetylmuramoyl-L-alanine amidase [Parachlamydiaceae bacterium]|nr:N-acetylmuramoyl-L-alanine amidase [Parachlamydiaceae bacterium]
MAFNSCARRIEVVQVFEPQTIVEQPIIFRELPFLNATQPKEKKLIVIDPGHGGKDFGTEAPVKPSFKEKNLNLVTARLLKGYLDQMGYRTLLTRNEDFFVPLDKRASFANIRNSDLFVSIHYNSAPSVNAEGIEVFYFRTDNDLMRASASKSLADSVLKYLLDATDAKSRGVKHGNLAVVRKTTMPAILVESGFLTNEKELLKLKDPAYIKSIAWGIAQGIQAYLNSEL